MTSQKVAIIVQARMGSTRLPGKVLLPLADAPMIVRQLERLHRCRTTNDIIVATTTLSQDDALARTINDHTQAHLFRGSPDDVLQRYLDAAHQYAVDIIVRVTGDCPLIDPTILDAAVTTYMQHQGQATYVTNCIKRTYPRGLDVEVFPTTALEIAASEATTESDHEHVTPFIWRQPERFPRIDVLDQEDNSHHRWTVDVHEDYLLVNQVYDILYRVNPTFDYRAVLALLAARPDLVEVNRQVQQKTV